MKLLTTCHCVSSIPCLVQVGFDQLQASRLPLAFSHWLFQQPSANTCLLVLWVQCVFFFGLKNSAYCCWTFFSRWNRNTLHKTERNWGMILRVCHNERHLSYYTQPYDLLIISTQFYCSFFFFFFRVREGETKFYCSFDSQTGPTRSCLL